MQRVVVEPLAVLKVVVEEAAEVAAVDVPREAGKGQLAAVGKKGKEL